MEKCPDCGQQMEEEEIRAGRCVDCGEPDEAKSPAETPEVREEAGCCSPPCFEPEDW